jgi:parallel beta-helix repeat protein
LSDSTIFDNTISHNGGNGIFCEEVSDIVFKQNLVSWNSQRNVYTYKCHNLTFVENTFESHGNEMNQCSNISILANTFKDALIFVHHSNYNLIQGNTMSEAGIYLSDSSYNMITSNTISVDMKLYGISLELGSNNNTITGNTITYEQGGCFYEDTSCTGNIIENNSCTQRIISGFEIIVLFSIICITSVGLIVIYKKKLMFKKF